MGGYIVVVTATDSEQLARKLAKGALEKKLCACVQISKIESFYHWNGGIESAKEYKIEFKTAKNKADDLKSYLNKNHNYTIPEIIVLNIADGNKSYFNWIDESLNM